MIDACGVVLAGGKSTRMGADKTLLQLDGETLIERSVRKLSQTFAEVLIVSSKPDSFGLPGIREVTDLYPGQGPLGGIHAALKAASHDFLLITACDMPFWEQEIAEYLMQSCTGYDAVIPRIGGFYEPLLAVYGKSCLSIVESFLANHHYKVSDLYAALKIHYIEENELEKICRTQLAFFNLNTPDEWYNRPIGTNQQAVLNPR